MDNLEFLDAPQGANAETQSNETPAETPSEQPQAADQAIESEPVPGETAEQTATRERDERGRFKAKTDQEPVMVPLQALHETRDEVKALKQQLAAITQPQQQPQTYQAPDMFENPEGWQAHIQNTIAQTTLNDRLNVSEEIVRQSAGNETVNAAQEWGRQMLTHNPMFAQIFYGQRNPYGFLVKEHQRFRAISQLGDDPKQLDDFLAWKSTQGGQSQPGPRANPQQPAPPRSIASATSAGGVQHSAMGPGVAFGNTIK
jgi:hypothetical protein